MAEKTNMEYLKEFIKVLEGFQEEMGDLAKKLNEAHTVIGNLKIKNAGQAEEIELLQSSLESDADLEIIDCGIGVILYREPDNLQLQSLMDDFKLQHQIKY